MYLSLTLSNLSLLVYLFVYYFFYPPVVLNLTHIQTFNCLKIDWTIYFCLKSCDFFSFSVMNVWMQVFDT